MRAFHGVPSPEMLLDVLRRDGTLPGVQVHVNEGAVQRRAAAQGARVLLSGRGGDECVSFSGRGHWRHLLLSGRWRRLAAECRDQDAASAAFPGARRGAAPASRPPARAAVEVAGRALGGAVAVVPLAHQGEDGIGVLVEYARAPVRLQHVPHLGLGEAQDFAEPGPQADVGADF